MRKWFWIAPVLLLAGCASNIAPKLHFPSPASEQSVLAAPAETGPEVNAHPAGEMPASSVIPAGTLFWARIDTPVSTGSSTRGDRFSATLAVPVVVEGQAVLPAGTILDGHVLIAKPSGHLSGHARLMLALDSFELNGRRYPLTMTSALSESQGHEKRNLVGIGGGAGMGAAIGAIAATGPGAVAGLGMGLFAGAVGTAVTGQKQIAFPAESIVAFSLGEAVRVDRG